MHKEENWTADTNGNAVRQNPERHPTQTRHHKHLKTDFVFIAEQVNARQTADGASQSIP